MMLKLLSPAHAGQLFAKSGQSMVEMNLILGFIASGRVKLVLELMGNDAEIKRFEDHFEAHLSSGRLSYHRIETIPLEELMSEVDGLFVHGLHYLLTRIQIKGLINRLPIFVHLHSLEMNYQHRLGFRLPWLDWDRKKAIYFISPSEITRNRILSLAYQPLGEEDVFPPAELVPHGNDLLSFPVESGAALRKQLDIATDAKVILSFNRIDLQKFDYVQLLVIFLKLCRKHPTKKLVLLISGSVSYDEQKHVDALGHMCEELGIADKVRFFTDVEEGQKSAVYAAADLYLSLACNPQESFGIALLEAMAAGLPIVATNWNGYGEVLGEGYENLLIPTMSSHEIAWKKEAQENLQGLSQATAPLTDEALRLLGELVTNTHKCEGLAAYGRERASQFTWEHTVNRLIDLWEKALQETKNNAILTHSSQGVKLVKSPVDGLATDYLNPTIKLSRCTDLSAQELDKLIQTTVRTEGERQYLPIMKGILDQLDGQVLELGRLYVPGVNDYALLFQIVLSMIRRGLITLIHD